MALPSNTDLPEAPDLVIGIPPAPRGEVTLADIDRRLDGLLSLQHEIANRMLDVAQMTRATLEAMNGLLGALDAAVLDVQQRLASIHEAVK